MITPSDITTSVSDDRKSYHPDLIVEAVLELREIVTINYRYRDESKAIDHAKEMAKHGIRHRLYGDLRDLIEELYEIAMVKTPHSQELDKVRELKDQIDKIMGGET